MIQWSLESTWSKSTRCLPMQVRRSIVIVPSTYLDQNKTNHNTFLTIHDHVRTFFALGTFSFVVVPLWFNDWQHGKDVQVKNLCPLLKIFSTDCKRKGSIMLTHCMFIVVLKTNKDFFPPKKLDLWGNNSKYGNSCSAVTGNAVRESLNMPQASEKLPHLWQVNPATPSSALLLFYLCGL